MFRWTLGRLGLGDHYALVLRTRPPVDEEGEEVGDADGAVAIKAAQDVRSDDGHLPQAPSRMTGSVGLVVPSPLRSPPTRPRQPNRIPNSNAQNDWFVFGWPLVFGSVVCHVRRLGSLPIPCR